MNFRREKSSPHLWHEMKLFYDYDFTLRRTNALAKTSPKAEISRGRVILGRNMDVSHDGEEPLRRNHLN